MNPKVMGKRVWWDSLGHRMRHDKKAELLGRLDTPSQSLDVTRIFLTKIHSANSLRLYGEEITAEKMFGKPLYEFIEDSDYEEKRSDLIEAKVKVYGHCECDGLISISDEDDIEYCEDCGKPLLEGEIRQMSMSSGLARPDSEPVKKVGRNEPCVCGSGKKYKKCCGARSVN